jgi:hypothetical protein
MEAKHFNAFYYIPSRDFVYVVELDQEYMDLDELVGMNVLVFRPDGDPVGIWVEEVERDIHPPPWKKGEKVGLKSRWPKRYDLRPWTPKRLNWIYMEEYKHIEGNIYHGNQDQESKREDHSPLRS